MPRLPGFLPLVASPPSRHVLHCRLGVPPVHEATGGHGPVIPDLLVCLIDKVAVYSFYCCIVAVAGRVTGDGFLQRILRRDDKIDRIKSGYIYKMFHDSQMTDM